ncbi:MULTISPECIES: MFS transporter [Chryseobacterium]|uniref:MFS family permease n=1 Tax=Chryseobacterium camelliae TaxID=1265445 RepID=A0ABU0TGJ8_9FLAO|nr:MULTISPECIES: MFS transporter [Chryseobacterium]MDT3406032.1 MFS family permease [Pseudacidovorax intermedius]MDQ1096167.1 MFS family permease [Chryseobacterium camelliae]MDQ1100103.1 MFS family permease [Chryseobacterium sp. SORGH_AS_1048]MDR6087447.1 MFS family permease [Chryseobacterium sp. SORGH_AS_0909]MDR6131821.1 MFS family permease [Chryseobacterium sp. SORGH_AS_1175]
MNKLSNISTFRAFRSTNYTLYFFGRSVSQFGTWMQRTAVVWVVYSMTQSAFMLGLTIFAEQFPSFLFSAFGGVAADRYNRYRIIQITQILSLIQASLLAFLVMTGHQNIWSFIILSVFLGIINAYDVPARQAMINEVVTDDEDLPSALSLSAAMASIAKLAGPALSGIILQKFGAGACFLINAASFAAVMASISLMKITVIPKKQTKKGTFTELAEGFRYLRKEPSISMVIIMLSITGLLILPYDTLIPVYAKEIFKGDAKTFGYISSFIGIGAVLGTVFLASLKKGASMRNILILSTMILSIGLILFSYTTNFYWSMFFAALTGLGGVAQFTTCNIIVQSEVIPEMRSRAISILLTAIFGMLPLGSVLIGFVSERIGAPTTLLLEGIAGIVIAVVFWNLLFKNKKTKAVDEELLEKSEEQFINKI